MTARKDGLERSHPVIPLTREEAARLVHPLREGAALESVELLRGGLGNSNYVLYFADDSAPVVIRLHARGAESRETELNVLRLVRDRVPAPRVFGAGDDAVDGTHAYSILERCPGKTVNDWLPTLDAAGVASIARAVGATLAGMATITLEQPGLLAPDLSVKAPMFEGDHPYYDFFVDCLSDGGNAGRGLGEPLRDRLWGFVSAHRELLEGLTPERTLVHADFDGTNIIVDRRRDGGFEVTGVIDWEYAMSGPRVIDLSSILRYPENLPPGFEPALLAGFEGAGGVLLEPWEILARFVDMFAYCAFLNKESAVSRRRIYEMALRSVDQKLLALGY